MLKCSCHYENINRSSDHLSNYTAVNSVKEILFLKITLDKTIRKKVCVKRDGGREVERKSGGRNWGRRKEKVAEDGK